MTWIRLWVDVFFIVCNQFFLSHFLSYRYFLKMRKLIWELKQIKTREILIWNIFQIVQFSKWIAFFKLYSLTGIYFNILKSLVTVDTLQISKNSMLKLIFHNYLKYRSKIVFLTTKCVCFKAWYIIIIT